MKLNDQNIGTKENSTLEQTVPGRDMEEQSYQCLYCWTFHKKYFNTMPKFKFRLQNIDTQEQVIRTNISRYSE